MNEFTDQEKINRHDSFMSWFETFKTEAKARSSGHIVHAIVRQVESVLQESKTGNCTKNGQ